MEIEGARVIVRKALIIYGTKTGNTRAVAEAIAKGLNATKTVEVVVMDVKVAKPKEALAYDVVLIGSANHMGEPVGDVKKFLKNLEKLNLQGKTGAIFDSHIKGDKRAIQKMEKQVREKILGITLVIPGWGVEATGILKGPLMEGELAKAERFGETLSTKI